MKKAFVVITILLFCTKLSFSQNEESRIENLKNSMELAKIEIPKLENPVNINLSNTSLSNFLLAVAKVHELNIHVDESLSSISIVNNFGNVAISDLLIFLAEQYNLSIKFSGNIISVSQYNPPIPEVKEKEIKVNYNTENKLLSLDLKNDELHKVFRKISNLTGKNLLYAPELENLPLNIYMLKVPVVAALNKLALANSLKVSTSKDGFFIFNTNNKESAAQKLIDNSDNDDVEIIDPYHQILKVNLKNANAESTILNIVKRLDLNIFLASSLSSLKPITLNSDKITFEELLDYTFKNNKAPAEINDARQQNYQSVNSPNYTYKIENNIYFFGTEDQLLLKSVERIALLHRSIKLMADPQSNFGMQNTGLNMPYTNNYGTTNYNSDYNNSTLNQNRTSQNYRNNYSNTDRQSNSETIDILFPKEITHGLDIKIDQELNSFIVQGSPTKIRQFKNFIKTIDQPVPVILIEVMILEVNKTSLVETGVSFGLGEESIKTKGQVFPSSNLQIGASSINKVIGNFNGFGSLNLGKVVPEFYMNVKAMEANGNLKILSTPKLSTLNGHKAHLSNGETTYYAVTSQNFYGSQITQTSEITNYYPINAELAIEILPFVAGDGQVTMEINVSQASFNGERIEENAPPGMNSREFSSIIRMQNQDVAILGGIEEKTKDDSGTGVPLLARIPIIKWLLSSRRREDSNKKLNILIKPTVIY